MYGVYLGHCTPIIVIIWQLLRKGDIIENSEQLANENEYQ